MYKYTHFGLIYVQTLVKWNKIGTQFPYSEQSTYKCYTNKHWRIM